MAFHVVFAAPVDLAAIAEGARAGANPGHTNGRLAEMLGATVHDGAGLRPSAIDRLVGRLFGTAPLCWAIARRLRASVAPGDVLFCTGEDIGLPVAALCGGRRAARVAMMVHNLDRARGRLALRLLGIGRKAALFFAVAAPQVDFLRRALKLDADRVRFLFDQTDLGFFVPGPPSTPKARPIVASVGLEQRDYRTLAHATADLDLDVRISGFSRDARALARAFPKTLPANMDRRFYPWPDLVQLYRDADLVVVSLADNGYAAGVQVMMEAMACARPVIVTRTEGLAAYLDRPDAVTTVPPGDPAAMREAIERVLTVPEQGAAQGAAALALAHDRHATGCYVETIAAALRALDAG